MWHQLWIPVLLPTLIIKSNCDINKTDPNIFVRYGGHAEVDYVHQEPSTNTVTVVKTVAITTPVGTAPTTTKKPTEPSSTTTLSEKPTDDVVFIPNSKTTVKIEEEDYNNYDNLKIKDIMLMKTVDNAVGKGFHVEKPAEPNDDIVFITGKNHDGEKIKSDDTRRRDNNNDNQLEINEEFDPGSKLNCSHLDCNSTLSSICGVKYVENQWRYRLFLNDCYYRKVNCAFKYELNRYKQVAVDRCKTIGTHMERPLSFKQNSFIYQKSTDPPDIAYRRSSYSRRSMTMDYNGQICSHPCPVACPDDYDPQCAVSGTGQKRVFMNHCKLDLNSCFYSVVWHKRPLADCVGGKKADMRQNRGFIGWMQRVGIVDNRGRLVLE